MADNYSWSDANSKGYKTGDYDGVAGKIVPITRNTVADGDLLNSTYVEVFSSRDEYLSANLYDLDDKVTTTRTIVSTYSANEWDNAKLSGFSAILVNKANITASQNDDLTIDIIGAIEATKNSDNTVNLKAPDYLTKSYWNKTISLGTPRCLLPATNASTPSGGAAVFGGSLNAPRYEKTYKVIGNNAFVFNCSDVGGGER